MWTIGGLSVQNSALVGALIVDFAIQWVSSFLATCCTSVPLIRLNQKHAQSIHSHVKSTITCLLLKLLTTQSFVCLTHGTVQVGWGVSATFRTEKLYDALGSSAFAACAIGTLTYAKYYYARQIVATVFVMVWAARLGGFLLFRVLKTGADSRFDEVKSQPCKLLGLCRCKRRTVFADAHAEIIHVIVCHAQ